MAESDTDIARELKQAISTVSGVPEINENDRLWHDLKLRGEDAYEIITLLHTKYGVSFDQFEFNDYFPDESLSLRDLIAFIKSYPKSSKKELKVSDILNWIASKKFTR